MNGDVVRVAVAQFAPRAFDVDANARRLADLAAGADADVVVAPELALTGYELGDEAVHLARPVTPGGAAPFEAAPPGPGLDLVVGLVEGGAPGRVYNSVAHVRGGRVLARHRKVYLPTYGMFDEGRVFARGDRVRAYDAGHGWRFGLLVCEDLWHPALAYLLAVQGVHAILVAAAAPGRGAWEGGESTGRFASTESWMRIATVTAQLYGVYVVLANRVGVEGELTFAGGSCIIGPSGRVRASAPEYGDAVIRAEISLADVARARRPFDHGRDDDPDLTLRELRRALRVDRA